MTIRQGQGPKLRIARGALLVAVLTVVGGCASIKEAPGINLLFGEEDSVLGADPTAVAGIDYTIAVQGLGVGETPDETAENLRLLEIVKTQARVYKLQDKPPPSVALLKRRAAADVDLVERALKSEGYYEGTATISVDGEEKSIVIDDDTTNAEVKADALADEINDANDAPEPKPIFDDIADPDAPPVVNIFVRKGPRYSLARQLTPIEPEVSPEVAERVRTAAAQNVGGPAQGVAVVNAEQAALGELNRVGRPYARKGTRRARANFDFDTLEVATPLIPGPLTVYGDTRIDGLVQVEEKYIRDFITWKRGEPVSRGTLRDAQRALASTRLFDSVTVEIPATPPEDLPEGETFFAPVAITTEEAQHRTISGGLSYSTTDGPGVTAEWQHRNLFGQNEQLTVGTEIDLVRQSFGVNYVKPRYGKAERDLIAGIEVFHEDDDAFEIFGTTGTVGFEEQFTPYLAGTAGIGFEVAQTKEDGQTRDSYLIGVPVTLTYDRTNSLLDPTEGVRASAGLAPWGGVFDDQEAGFLVADVHGSTYIPFDRDRLYVLALRARAATVFAERRERVPANRRLFAGGGGSVRGYENQYVGPLDDDDDPLGGLSAAELAAEMRIRFGNIGVVPFVDAGIVGEEVFSNFDQLRYGAGLGLRYYSPVGPIRVDVAVPLNKRDRDPAFQFYISIGQAF